MSEVEGVYSRIELAQLKCLKLAEADLRAGVQVDFNNIELPVSINRLSLPDLKEKIIRLQTFYSDKVLSGSVHTLISTQIVDGTPFATIEGMYENFEDAQNRQNKIRDWYTENVSKEAKTAGFEMSLDHRAHYYRIPGQNDLCNAVWTGTRTWLPQMRSQYYDIPPGAMVNVRTFVNSIDEADGLSADHPLPQEGVPFQGNHMHSRLDPSHPGRVHVSAIANGVRSSFSYPASKKTQSRRTVNCHGCGCGEYNCDSCWVSATMTIAMVLILKKRMTKEKRANMRLEVTNQPRQFVSWVSIAVAVDAATQDAVHAMEPSSLSKVSSRALMDLAAKDKSKLPGR
jgi:hypothetical protein